MKEMILFSFFLVPYLIKAIKITSIEVGRAEVTSLDTTILEDTYFYMTVHPEKYGNLYFFLNDTYYLLTEVKFYPCMSTPNETLISSASNNFRTIDHYKTESGLGFKEYYYKYSFGEETWGKEKYLVIKYKGENSSGSLKVRSSFDDLYSLNHSTLSSLGIVLIAAGCIIFIGVLSTVLVFVFRKKKKTNVKVGTIDPSPLVRESTCSASLKGIN